MNSTELLHVVVAFLALIVVGVYLVVLPRASSAHAGAGILGSLSAALFAAALAFYLVELFGIKPRS